MSLFGFAKQKASNNRTKKAKYRNKLAEIGIFKFHPHFWSFLVIVSITLSLSLGYKVINDPNFVGSIRVNLFGDNFKLEVVREAK